MKRKLFFTLLLIEVILISGCAGNVKTAPAASTQVTHLDTLEFALDPPIPEELLDAIKFTDAKYKRIVAFNNRWVLSSGSLGWGLGSINSIEQAESSDNDKDMLPIYLDLAKDGKINYTEPNIFYTPDTRDITQFCEKLRIRGSVDNDIVDRVILALKNYNCSLSARVNVLSVKVPKSATVINKEALEYVKNKGVLLVSYETGEDRY